ncbi:MAG: hypothetical protein KDD22_01375, partial [Bdellovibrionales bacterium]|nr:hypothetical protein [Bdellovibrionales bacterium]
MISVRIESAEQFLKVADQFLLGDLPTEQSHPHTQNLSSQAQVNLLEALETLKSVDLKALQIFASKFERMKALHLQIQSVLDQGHRVFFCGCGATGRLSLTLEALWREAHPHSDQIVSFMAGGDVALVHALEGFEDRADFGARQLEDLGFGPNDLLIGSSEGGETPYVIGAVMRAAEMSNEKPAFIFCNPPEVLLKLERCRQIFECPRVQNIEIGVGPMALCGSTRMQASTVLLLGLG